MARTKLPVLEKRDCKLQLYLKPAVFGMLMKQAKDNGYTDDDGNPQVAVFVNDVLEARTQHSKMKPEIEKKLAAIAKKFIKSKVGLRKG